MEDHLTRGRGGRDGLRIPQVSVHEPDAVGADEVVSGAVGEIVEADHVVAVDDEARGQM
jgi:hypothetical protein